ncbi:MAG TPA: 2-oxoglutarate ferredoxin oxidoreductase subunit alpha [Flavobacteriales bacterium]|jgi:2-oxoglutarate/2-oxoacid ferredoxin oxidoreductase subunit alpha|nr:2-oxoacid:acceptor oxidoreductase subunit alpha [Flavobacteriales bacterium]HAW20635.1 2-oxoglutarate ferredoxin oxidoreductase subunit alpha [Flavobacteriales bacterium]
MTKTTEKRKDVTILFAGDSGDGMQLTGSLFTDTNAHYGNDISTFPNFPAEIRAPQGTVAGVSGFKLHFASVDIFTPGDEVEVLVAMNAAALKANVSQLKKGGTIIANTAGFDKKNLRLAKYESDVSPLLDKTLDQFRVVEIDVTKMTKEALANSGLGTKDIDRCKNMFVLGFLLWMYNRSMETTQSFITEKFSKKPDIKDANLTVLKAGYYFGDTNETFTSRYEVESANLPSGEYRSIMGNQAAALGAIVAANKAGLELFYGSYPITPASDILHELARHKNYGVKTFQAEDEIAAICASIGASFGGSLGMTASSGPGIALKGEAMGLAVMLEIPLLIINVQRGGPSTGLPTKTEQSDLMQAMYGRNGEAPLVIVSASHPSDCFDAMVEAVRITVEHMIPVMFMSDGFIANGSEPWSFPKAADISSITPRWADPEKSLSDETYFPFRRNEKLVREWAIPGMENLQHRVGGLEKENETGNVSYDPDNHELMVKIRQEKVDLIANHIPAQEIAQGDESGSVLVLGWGSTYGAIRTAVRDLIKDGHKVSQAHVRYLNPFPKNLEELMSKFDRVLIPEINNGQLVHLINAKYGTGAVPFNKIQGMPFTSREIKEQIKELI